MLHHSTNAHRAGLVLVLGLVACLLSSVAAMAYEQGLELEATTNSYEVISDDSGDHHEVWTENVLDGRRDLSGDYYVTVYYQDEDGEQAKTESVSFVDGDAATAVDIPRNSKVYGVVVTDTKP